MTVAESIEILPAKLTQTKTFMNITYSRYQPPVRGCRESAI